MRSIALRTVILLVVSVMVIAVALYFLVFVTNFDSLFLANDQRILKQYTTCVLAYCAAGAESDEVNAVGCLKYEEGRCVLSCAQVENEIYKQYNIEPTVTEIGGRGAPHYCGPDAKLEFKFSGVSLGGIVPLASGQMDKIATKPELVCKPIKIPFVGVELDSLGIPTTDIQHGGVLGAPQNCIILSGKVSPILSAREGCFMPIKYDKSYDDIYFTPIIEYDEPQQIIYPSAIYVDRSFTETIAGASQPECDFRNAPNHGKVSEEEITKRIKEIVNSPAVIEGKQTDKTYQQYYDDLGSQGKTEEQKKLADTLVANYLADLSTDDNLIGNVLNRCNFKTTRGGEKITYHVWAKPVYPTIDAMKDFAKIGDLQNFIASLLGSVSPDLKVAFSYVTEAGEDGTKLIFSQLGGSCTAVVLGRDLNEEILLTKDEGGDERTGSIVELVTDRISYSAGETVEIMGKVKMVEGSKFSVEMKRADIIGGVLIPVDATLSGDGSFNFVYEIPEGIRGVSGPARYKITAMYGGDKKEIEFTVG